MIADSNTPCALKMLTYVLSLEVMTKYRSVRQNSILNTFSIEFSGSLPDECVNKQI